MSGYKQLIIDTCLKHGLLRNQAAYVLATAEWETNRTFEPVKEAYWVKNAEQWRKKNLRYYPWHGRGFVQLTWERNYKHAGQKIGVDLIANPDAAMQPDNAANILVIGMVEGWFTGKKLADYITLQKSQFTAARRIINGNDKAKDIAAIARRHDKELKANGYGETSATQPRKPNSHPIAPDTHNNAPSGILALFISLFKAIFKRGA